MIKALNAKFLPFYTILYILTFHSVYVEYLSVVFDYAHYTYKYPGVFELFFGYIICFIPVLLRANNKSLAAFSFDVIYTLIYIPSQLMSLFMWSFEWSDYYWLSFFMFSGISIIAGAGHFFKPSRESSQYPNLGFKVIIYFISLLGLFLVFVNYWSTMSLVGFDKVYELREQANSSSKGPLVDYLMTWLTFVSLPYFLAISFSKKSKSFFLYAIVISLILYSAQGAKIAILNSAIVFTIFIFFVSKGDFLVKILLASSVTFLFISFVLPDDGLWLWFKSILMVRIFGNAGWMIVTYHDYFSLHGYTYLSHIGILNKIFDYYPYGNYSLGQLIGIEYSGSSEANFNANFWASDGIAGVGSIGIPIVSFIFTIYLIILNYFTRRINVLFLYLFFSGFLMSLLNLPLSTAMLSGGGLLILFLFVVNNKFKL